MLAKSFAELRSLIDDTKPTVSSCSGKFDMGSALLGWIARSHERAERNFYAIETGAHARCAAAE
jgi:hypothetical protein